MLMQQQLPISRSACVDTHSLCAAVQHAAVVWFAAGLWCQVVVLQDRVSTQVKPQPATKQLVQIWWHSKNQAGQKAAAGWLDAVRSR